MIGPTALSKHNVAKSHRGSGLSAGPKSWYPNVLRSVAVAHDILWIFFITTSHFPHTLVLCPLEGFPVDAALIAADSLSR